MPGIKTNIDSDLLAAESLAAARSGLLCGIVAAAGTAGTAEASWAWGLASVKPGRRALGTSFLFDLASVTKAVATASACVKCIETGLLDTEAPVVEYLPGAGQFPGSTVRVIDLAVHCSGYDNSKFDSCSPDELFRQTVEAPAKWPARERYQYSCRNFIILGLIVEKITGENLSNFCHENLFMPAGMKNTAFGPLRENLEDVVPAQQPAGVINDDQARKAGRPVGNAGLFSNAKDLSSFCRMILNGGRADGKCLFGARAMELLTKPQSPPGFPKKSFGWDMRPYDECPHRPSGLSDKAIGHSGSTGQSVWIDPELNIYAIVLTNRTHVPNPGPLVAQNEASERFRAGIADIMISHIPDNR